MSSVPQFPDCREITLEDKPLFDEIFSKHPPESSAYTFTNIFAWRLGNESRLSNVGDALLVRKAAQGHSCPQPLGADDPAAAIIDVFKQANDNISFEQVSAEVADVLRGDPAFVVEPDPDNSDYVYLSDDLINLPGRKYDGKRNHITRFQSENDYQYLTLDQELAQECIEFADRWCEDKPCESDEGLAQEKCAVFQMLTHFDELGIVGGALRVGGEIIACSLGEALNPETLVVHVEKADSKVAGSYQVISNEFCTHEAGKFEYVNREQDLGIRGLRKAKQSYHPVRMVETYQVRPA